MTNQKLKYDNNKLNSNCKKTQKTKKVSKYRMWQNSECEKTKELKILKLKAKMLQNTKHKKWQFKNLKGYKTQKL